MIKLKFPEIPNVKFTKTLMTVLMFLSVTLAFLFGWVAFPLVFIGLFVASIVFESYADERIPTNDFFHGFFWIYLIILLGGLTACYTILTTDHRKIVYHDNKPAAVKYLYTSDGVDPATFDCEGLMSNLWINPLTECAVFEQNVVSFDINESCQLCVDDDCKNTSQIGNAEFAKRFNTKDHRLICDGKQLYPTDFSQYVEVQ